jgi:hypothetical protein
MLGRCSDYLLRGADVLMSCRDGHAVADEGLMVVLGRAVADDETVRQWGMYKDRPRVQTYDAGWNGRRYQQCLCKASQHDWCHLTYSLEASSVRSSSRHELGVVIRCYQNQALMELAIRRVSGHLSYRQGSWGH